MPDKMSPCKPDIQRKIGIRIPGRRKVVELDEKIEIA